MSKKKLSPLVAIFLTVFIDMLGFGIVIPDIQRRGEVLVGAGPQLGMLIAVYSLVSFIFAPLMGRWSDKIGRRGILVFTSLLAVASFGIYAFATEPWIMILSRALGGLSAANLGVAFAYVADVTKPEDRSKSMGLIGMAFGLGFILGPPIGGLLGQLDHKAYLATQGLQLTRETELLAFQGAPFLMGMAAAAFCFINFLVVVFALPESLKPGAEKAKAFNFQSLVTAFKTPGLSTLLILFFVANFAFTNLESTYFNLVNIRFGMTQSEGTYVLAAVGVATAFMQGYFIRVLLAKFTEPSLLRFSYLLQGPLLISVPFFGPWIPMLLGAVGLGLSSGLSQPILSGLISQQTPPEMQGGIFGVTQGLGSMARIIGPIAGNWMLGIHPVLPYAVAGVLMIIPLTLAWKFNAASQRAAG
jgi:MFS family permease